MPLMTTWVGIGLLLFVVAIMCPHLFHADEKDVHGALDHRLLEPERFILFALFLFVFFWPIVLLAVSAGRER